VDLDNKTAALPAQVDGQKQPLAAQRYLFDYEVMNEMSENENRDDEDLSIKGSVKSRNEYRARSPSDNILFITQVPGATNLSTKIKEQKPPLQYISMR